MEMSNVKINLLKIKIKILKDHDEHIDSLDKDFKNKRPTYRESRSQFL